MGMDYWLARTYVGYSNLYRKEGDHPQAKENLNKAIEIFKECGAEGCDCAVCYWMEHHSIGIDESC